ncbi:MAG: hypothetical protein NT049_10930, partial [Planctomycetota bacterium]|nr:hypothetical protein [Planctomycetota bacterium]
RLQPRRGPPRKTGGGNEAVVPVDANRRYTPMAYGINGDSGSVAANRRYKPLAYGIKEAQASAAPWPVPENQRRQ